MKTQHLAALLGAALAIVAAVFLFIPVHSHGVDCGSAASDSGKAAMADIEQGYESALEGDGVTSLTPITDACASARSTHQTLALALGIPGLVLLLGGGGYAISDAGKKRAASEAAVADSSAGPDSP